MIDNEQDRVTGDEGTVAAGDSGVKRDAWGQAADEDYSVDVEESVGEKGYDSGGTGQREGVAASVPSVFSTGKDPATGRFLPGNRLNQLAVRRDQATVDAIKAEFHPARVVSMLNMAWDAAESRNSPRAMKDITELILSYLIGKPTQYNVTSRMDGNMLLTLLRDARAPGQEDTGDNGGE